MGDYDVIVAGGGTAGTAAAIASARAGAKTLLLERHGCLGGAATMRNVLTFCGLYTLGETPQMAVGGIGAEVIARLRARGAVTPPQRFRGVFAVFDPEALKRVFDEMATEAGVDLRFGALVTGAARDGDRMSGLTVADHGGSHQVAARAFVDCTGEGDLAALGGAATRYGNDGAVNLGTLGTRFGGIPAGVTITADQIAAAVAAQGFAPGRVTKDRCVIVRVPVSGDMVLYLASADYDPRDALSLSRAEVDARRQAWAYLDAIRTIPGCETAYLASTGPEIGTRESRHLTCRHHLTWDEIAARKDFDDCIALGAWGAEWHDRADFKSSFDYPPGKSAYEIPLGCLHSVDTPNLFCAGRLADGDRKAGAAIRVMGTAMATGQAAGIAAALTAHGRFAPEAVRDTLRASGALLEVEALQPA
ncbi:FAD-dependent oxidoreductase [Antarcticimicrobium luteum]|uniref:FAD-dependent oxidoreductase n=1 Tax=Antarcticimicrobium luteum TaxID=2547397 RepID=A0A4R5V9R7_9RHOB|nr:FAD-dependent oxidoreductase [Antarcticimicrobium luteum]TDK48741.1 FAD-dependent oxidoreductase [Antarcticimicrobium luteum]